MSTCQTFVVSKQKGGVGYYLRSICRVFPPLLAKGSPIIETCSWPLVNFAIPTLTKREGFVRMNYDVGEMYINWYEYKTQNIGATSGPVQNNIYIFAIFTIFIRRE